MRRQPDGYPRSVSESERQAARLRLIRLLQGAYSGELAASHAYIGHARSVRDEAERSRIRAIENEELVHRACVGKMLASLDAAPSAARERIMLRVGQTIGLLCRVGGWFIPMYGAGRLEAHNVKEYEDAADDAVRCGRADLVEELLVMAEVEWEHEHYFREKVLSHALGRIVPVWKAIPPKEAIRRSHAARHGAPMSLARREGGLVAELGGQPPHLTDDIVRDTVERSRR